MRKGNQKTNKNNLRHYNSPLPAPIHPSDIHPSTYRQFWIGTNNLNLHGLSIQKYIIISFKSSKCITSSSINDFSWTLLHSLYQRVIPRNSEALAGTLEPCYNLSMSKIGYLITFLPLFPNKINKH